MCSIIPVPHLSLSVAVWPQVCVYSARPAVPLPKEEKNSSIASIPWYCPMELPRRARVSLNGFRER